MKISEVVQKQNRTRKAVKALVVLLPVLAWTFLHLLQKLKKHPSTPRNAVHLALMAGAEEQT